MKVGTATPDQFEAIGDVTVEAYRAAGILDYDESYVAELRAVDDRVSDADVIVAVDDDGTVIGSVTLCLHGSRFAEVAGPGEADFRMLAVSLSARGTGAGAALVRACVDRARAAGCVRLRLSARPQAVDAHRLYERLGFRRTPDRDWDPLPDFLLITYVLDL